MSTSLVMSHLVKVLLWARQAAPSAPWKQSPIDVKVSKAAATMTYANVHQPKAISLFPFMDRDWRMKRTAAIRWEAVVAPPEAIGST